MDNFMDNLMYQVGNQGGSQAAAPNASANAMRHESLLDESPDDWMQGGTDFGVPKQNVFGADRATAYNAAPTQHIQPQAFSSRRDMRSQAFSSGQMMQPQAIPAGPAAQIPTVPVNPAMPTLKPHISADRQPQSPLPQVHAEVDMEAIKSALSEELSRQGSTLEAFTQKYNNDSQKNLADTYQHVHRENVKCYRNTQAVIIENTNVLRQLVDERQASLKSMILGAIVLGILNLGISALLMLHLIFGIL